VDDDTDRVLVGRYRNGDRAAFAEIVIRYQQPIYNAAFWVLASSKMHRTWRRSCSSR